MRVFICSRDDVVTRLDWEDGSTEAQPVLEGVPVRCVAADGDRVIIGTQGAGALLSSDGGRRWERMELPEPDVFSVAIGPPDGTLYAGTEPSRRHSAERAYGRLYRWDGDAWRELPVPDESMTYALAALADTLVCGMADGRLLHSPDRGESWQELAVTTPIGAMALAP
jgi:sugar lactone lactonase YvrE